MDLAIVCGAMRNMVSWWDHYAGQPVLCAVHSNAPPRFDEWTDYLRLARETIAQFPGSGTVVGLAVTDGGAPNLAQRSALVSIDGLVKPTTAVVTANRMVRAVAAALSMFEYQIRVFPPERFADTCEHLRIPIEGRSQLIDDIRARAQELPRCATSDALRL